MLDAVALSIKPYPAWMFGVQSLGAKLIRTKGAPDRFYDLAADPLELYPNTSKSGERAALEKKLEYLLSKSEDVSGGKQPIPSKERIDNLRSLGYLN